jgi:hypothetical protein
MCDKNNLENKITILETSITELKEKIFKLETIIINNHCNNDYNIKNEVNLDNIVSYRSNDFSEPKLVRQHAFMFTRP